jgi:hypothetical protein
LLPNPAKISQFRELFQANGNAVSVGTSATNCYAQPVAISRKPVVVTMNPGPALNYLMKVDWIRANSYLINVGDDPMSIAPLVSTNTVVMDDPLECSVSWDSPRRKADVALGQSKFDAEKECQTTRRKVAKHLDTGGFHVTKHHFEMTCDNKVAEKDRQTKECELINVGNPNATIPPSAYA